VEWAFIPKQRPRTAEQRDELAPFLKALGAGRPTIFRDRERDVILATPGLTRGGA
jgi:hypothetical protein